MDGRDLRVCRVLHEDDALMTVEVVKDEDRFLDIRDGDRFLTLVFVHNVDGTMVPWRPWEHGA